MTLNKLAQFIALSFTFGVVQAATTDVADNPLAVVTSSEPNIMFIIDNSGSMNNIVPPNNFTAGTTSCPSTNYMVGAYNTVSAAALGAVFDTVILSDGTPRIRVYPPNTNTFYNYGTNSGERCFEDTKYYQARLRGDTLYTNGNNTNSPCGARNASCRAPNNYLWAIYRGDFLNWYYSGGTLGTVASFGVNADRKPGTETRLEAAKTASKAVIDTLPNVRVGLTTFDAGNGGSLREIMGTATAAKKTAVKAKIDALTTDSYTPLAETLADIGRYFTTGYTGNLTLHPGAGNQSTNTVANVFPHSIQNSSGQTVTAPVQYWCQKSFAVLMTDGRPQYDQTVASSLCDYLGIVGSCPTSGTRPIPPPAYGTKNAPNGTGANSGYHVRTAGGTTYLQLHEGGDHSYEDFGSDYLDDVAGALFDIDLRPDLVKPSGNVSKNNISTYTIGFADEQVKIDPLLRETATAGGGFFRTANNASDLAQVFDDIIKDVEAKTGSAAAVAVANAHVTQNDNASYSTSYNSGSWTGDVIAYPIDIGTGVPVTSTPIWNTGCGATVPARLTALVVSGDPAKGVRGCSAMVQLGEMSNPVADRKIVTSTDTVLPCNSGCGIQFQPTTAGTTTKISATQKNWLNTPSTTDGDAVVNYLRGANDSNYRTIAPIDGSNGDRQLMGDPINAEPLVIRNPDRNYTDPGYVTYTATTRTSIVIQAANDGMVHAFNALTGAEEWAYIPNLLISNSRDPNDATVSLLNTRTRKTSFNHYPLIDATPIAADVDFGNTGVATPGTVDWRTIVVGGLGKGGRGFYALDVTATTAANEAAATSKVLWEFPNSVNDSDRPDAIINTGFSFGKPIIVKTAAQGWVVLVTSGYNNGGGDGEAHLFVLNAKTGDLIKDLKSSGCTNAPATNPCGLAQISAYVEHADVDNTVKQVYGGDLYGNVWRFDLSGPTVASWTISKLAVLTDGNDPQPVTSAPELAKITVSGADKRLVYIGTGQYLGNSDLPCSATCPWTPNAGVTQTQSMYALVDPMTGGTVATPTLPLALRPTLVEQTFTTSGSSRTFSTNTVDFNTKNGWYVDFTGGERMVADPAIALGVVVFTTIIPSNAVCAAGGTSWLYSVDYKTGGQVSGSFAGTAIPQGLASRPVLIQLPNGSVKALLRISDATTSAIGVPIPPASGVAQRVSWRELVD